MEQIQKTAQKILYFILRKKEIQKFKTVLIKMVIIKETMEIRFWKGFLELF